MYTSSVGILVCVFFFFFTSLSCKSRLSVCTCTHVWLCIREDMVCLFVSWYFEPTQPLQVTPELGNGKFHILSFIIASSTTASCFQQLRPLSMFDTNLHGGSHKSNTLNLHIMAAFVHHFIFTFV